MYAVCTITNEPLPERIERSAEPEHPRLLIQSPVTVAHYVAILRDVLMRRFVWEVESERQ